MPRIAVLPDARHLREKIDSQVLYLEEVDAQDLEDEYVSQQILERLRWAVQGRLFGVVGQ